jgi:PEP-CTERM motif
VKSVFFSLLLLGSASAQSAVLLNETFEGTTNIKNVLGQTLFAPSQGGYTVINAGNGGVANTSPGVAVYNSSFTGSNGNSWTTTSNFGSGVAALDFTGVGTPNLTTALELSARNYQVSQRSSSAVVTFASQVAGATLLTLEFDYVSSGIRPGTFSIRSAAIGVTPGAGYFSASLPVPINIGNSPAPVSVAGHYVGSWTSAVSPANFYLAFEGGFASNVAIDNVVITQVTAVPEPSEWALMLAGLGLVGVLGKRRKKTPTPE